ncbi:unnamed protein product [Lepeophtheirus salmonis]|uniref:(salmon louse) hypothetical protein n=1 Tax=Lepeophtheirus salmonis TaxID=72036 RepID=A0A7R8D277_LEPSM|nr:unnamed protein product [Lepeophtheirus salmonis]CAF3003054.1 unnamed protein product [Lepeophtheirus salmonis]
MYITSDDSNFPEQPTFSIHGPVTINNLTVSTINPRVIRKTSERNPSVTWKRNRLRFRLIGFFIVTALGLPGNLFVLYFYYFNSNSNRGEHEIKFANDSSIYDEISSSDFAKKNIMDASSLICYERIKDIDSYLEIISFWIEGVLLVSTGVIGLIGNILSLLVIFQDMKRTPFNSYLKKSYHLLMELF